MFGGKSIKAKTNNDNNIHSSQTNKSNKNKNNNNSINNSVNKSNGQCDTAVTDLYVSQLKSFIAKNSNEPFDYQHTKHTKKQKQKPKQKQIVEQPTEKHHSHHLNLSTNLLNSCEPNSQYKDLKQKCKRAVYKLMKGFFDERKLQKFRNFHQDEPIYFEVSISFDI